MASSALGDSLVFHGTPALVTGQLESQGFWKTLPRNVKILFGIIISGGSNEKIAHYASSLPPGDWLGSVLTKLMVNVLWGSLVHPPLSYKGIKHEYRSADGSNMSSLYPELGKAGMPYAKTVPSENAMPGARPDPGDLFDLLMARDDPTTHKESDLGVSSMLIYHADLIIHDIFRTNNDDRNISDTSSYLDLSPLYGRNREHQEAIRVMKDGLLKPDSFAEERLLNQPPGVTVYLIMYSRFHNYVARQLKEVNEHGRFSRTPRAAGWYPDEDTMKRILEEVSNVKGLTRTPKPADWNPPDSLLRSVAFDQAKAKDANVKNLGFRWKDTEELRLAAWNAGLDSIEDKQTPPPGWMPSPEPKLFNERLDEAWNRHLDVKIDEDLFQTARLVTCGLYINVAIHDYLRVLMRKHAENTSWTLDPRLDMSWAMNKKGIERGIGNVVTAEFNALYRFHSPLSKRDAEWTRVFLQQNIPPRYRPDGTDPNKLSQDDYDNAVISLTVMRQMLYQIQAEGGTVEDKKKLPYVPVFTPKFKRGPDGRFNDEELVKEICETMEDPLSPFGARNVPKFFRSIEILGILQARKWELSTLNEFRKFFGMKPHKTFADVNTDPDIQDRLRTLYQSPDMIELHPGLWCEGDSRCLDPGVSGPNGTGTALWRGVFSDAVTLVRSDRFYTLDWNVDSLTSWGMAEVTSNVKIFKGGVLGRLFQRAFPGYFKPDSIHLWQPFYTPAMNMLVAHDQGLLSELQDIKDLGVAPELWKKVQSYKGRNRLLFEDLDKVNVREAWGFKEADILDLKAIQKKVRDDFYSIPLLKRLLKHIDGTPLWRKLQFKLLRDVAKMQTFKRAETPTAVSDYNMIKDILHKYKSEFKNPGYADGSAFRNQDPSWLEEVLRGEKVVRNGKSLRGGGDDPQETGLKLMQDLVRTSKAKYPQYYVAHTFEGHDIDSHTVHAQGIKPEYKKSVERRVDEMFYDYFFFMAHRIRHREQLKYQSYKVSSTTNGHANGRANGKPDQEQRQIYQLDMVKDYAIPVIVRFLTDFLGFGHLIKTRKHKTRPYDENEIYEHFVNCQDYLTFDADETRAFRRRKAFQTSLAFLRKLTEEGVQDAQSMWFEGIRGRTYHIDDDDNELNRELRRFGIDCARKMTSHFYKNNYDRPREAAAAVMLAAALDASHKSVYMFTDVLQTLLSSYNDESGKSSRVFWGDIQRLAQSKNKDDKKVLMKYVLEAQRASVNIPLVRRFKPDPKSQVPTKGAKLSSASTAPVQDLQTGKEYLLEIQKAYKQFDGIDKSTPPGAAPRIDLKRPESEYLVYGLREDGLFDAKQLTIIAITALIQYAGTFRELREAHDNMGRLKTTKSPEVGIEVLDNYRERFMTIRWDQLVPYPTTWNLRYDGIGQGVASSGDNSLSGNPIELAGAAPADGTKLVKIGGVKVV